MKLSNCFSHSSLSDQCVKHVVGKEKLTHGLSHQDLFYREVSRIVEGLQFFGHWSENLAHSSRRPQEVAVALSEANTVFLVSSLNKCFCGVTYVQSLSFKT